MSNFKKQLDNIHIPESLNKRSLQGIQQAEKERRKPQNRVPKLVALVVTIAAVSFIALNVGEKDTHQQQTGTVIEKSAFSPQFYWLIAAVLTVVTGLVIRAAIRKGMNKKLGIASGVIIVLLLGNSAVFLQNQLAKPITVPLVHDFFAGNGAHDFAIRYIVNKNDHRSVSFLQAGELTLQALYPDETKGNDLFYYPTDISEEGRHQLMRGAYFQGNTEEIQVLIDSDEVFLVLDDGEKLATSLQIDFDSKYGPLLNENTYMSQGSNDGENSRTVIIEQDTVFDDVYLPKILESSVTFEKLEVDKVVHTEGDFPVAVKKGQLVKIIFKIDDASMDINTMVGVRGSNGLLPIKVFRKATIDLKKIREEIERHDGV